MPTSASLSEGRTLNNIRVVWPPKSDNPVRDRESALKLLHRMRRDIQVYEFERQRDQRKRKLSAAGLAAALAITGLPTAGVITSQASGGPAPSQDPLPSVVEQVNEIRTTGQYSLPLPLGQESLVREHPLVQPPLAVEFKQAVEYLIGPGEEAPAPAEATPAPQTAEVEAPPAEYVHPTVTFNSDRHATTEYVAPPAPSRSYAPSESYKGYVVDLIHRYFPASQADFAVRVAYCESGFNPNAVGDQGRARGIFQFWRATFLGTDVGATYGWDAAFDAEINVRAAAELVARGGWGPWTCARKV